MAQAQLARTGKAIARALERLSSGKRINSARDDAAGLAIANRLDASVRGLTQGIANTNQAMGYLQTADGTLDTLTDIVQRMRELAVQSSNEILNSTQRSNLQVEFSALYDEYSRIVRTTNFNGKDVFSAAGSSTTMKIQVGTQAGDDISLSLPSVAPTDIFQDDRWAGTFTTNQSFTNFSTPGFAYSSDVDDDGDIDILESANSSNVNIRVLLNDGTGRFTEAASLSEAGAALRIFAVEDLNGDGNSDIVASRSNQDKINVYLGNGSGGFTLSASYNAAGGPQRGAILDYDGDGKKDIAVGGQSTGVVSIFKGSGTGTFTFASSFTAVGSSLGVGAGDFNKDGYQDLAVNDGSTGHTRIWSGNGAGTFTNTQTVFSTSNSTQTIFDLDGDGNLDIVGANSSNISISYGSTAGTFSAVTFYAHPEGFTRSLSVGDVNGDGYNDIAAQGQTTGNAVLFLGNGSRSFTQNQRVGTGSTGSGVVMLADLNDDGFADMVTGVDGATASDPLTIRLATTSLQNSTDLLSISTAALAQNSLDILSYALDNIATARSSLGAQMSRLESAANNNSNMVENLSSARSQILDTDMASETSELMRSQILQQAQVSVNAQANLNLQIVLQLLKF